MPLAKFTIFRRNIDSIALRFLYCLTSQERKIVAEKKTQKKTPRKKKAQKQPKGTDNNTLILPEHELKSLFDHALKRAREITKKYDLK